MGEAAPSSRPPGAVLAGVMTAAVLAISSAAVLVRMAPEVHPLVVGFWRCLLVAVLLAPLARSRYGATAGRLTPRLAAAIGLAGLLLALHFAAWFASLHRTTVLRSTLLVCLTPFWAGLGEWLLWGERPPRSRWIGLAVALPGVLLLAGGASGRASLSGDLLALVGGALASGYLLIGRRVRQQVPFLAYAALVCAAAAACLLPAAWAVGAPLAGFAPRTWVVLVALAAGPQLVGHQGFNWVVRWLPASAVGAAILLEPVGASFLAALVLAELPPPRDVLAAAIVLGGVLLAVRGPSPGAVAPSPGPPEPSPRAGGGASR